MAINIKFTKFDNTPWGFRLAGGSDFPQPLTVIRVSEESLAECMGLKVGDVVVRLNDQPVSGLTHGQAHEELLRAGNNFVLGIQRGEDSARAVEALSEENIVPYKIPLAELPPVFPEEILKEETVIEEITYCEEVTTQEEAKPEVEPLPDKPKDANSEIVPNQNLTDDEIAQLILEEEELLTEQGVLGVNFKKLKPRAPILRESKVLEELQSIATADPPLVEELKRTSVFLQKPKRPVPVPRKKEEPQEEVEVESYRVVIKKQQRRSVTDRLLEKGLLRPEEAKTPEPTTPEVKMDSNEMTMKIEEDDSIDCSMELDNSQLSSERETIVSCSLPSCDEIRCEIPSNNSSLNSEREESLKSPQFPRRKENVALTRRSPSKHKFKYFYTRAHYFRRCLFGKRSHGDVKKSMKLKNSSKECYQDNDTHGYTKLKDSKGLLEESLRHSIDRSSKTRIKGRYLETYLKREDNLLRRIIKALIERPDNFCSSQMFDRFLSTREVSLRRTRYAEKILTRSIEFFVVYLRSELAKCFNEKWPYIAGNYAESATQGCKRRLYFKGRYFQHIFWNNIVRLINCVRNALFFNEAQGKAKKRYSGMIRMKGHYLERYLKSQDHQIVPTILDFLQTVIFDLRSLRRDFFKHPAILSSKRRFSYRTHYAERIIRQHFNSLALILMSIRSQMLPLIEGPLIDVTRVELSQESSILDSPTSEILSSTIPREENLSSFLRSSKEFISTELFHRGSRRLSKSKVLTSEESSSLLNIFRKNFNTNWLPSSFIRVSTAPSACDNKIIEEVDREGRRLSFVPTILYEGLTNRIGVDFTRLVAYAFVPCTSIVLLYMYK